LSADSQLSEIAASAVQHAASHKTVSDDQFAISLIDVTDPNNPRHGSVRGDEPFYPASVVKLFFLAAACIALEKHTLETTPKLLTALSEMIVDSSNQATSVVVDMLTDTNSGEELSKEEMVQWSHKRQLLNEVFLQQGYRNINICQKTWEDAPYGRDKAFLNADRGNRNSLTTNSTAKLMEAIVLGKIANPEHTNFMMKLLERDYAQASEDPDDQATGFCAAALPPGARLWSKAGWTSEVRHDAAYIELPNDQRIIMVIFTQGCPDDRKLIAELAAHIFSRLDKRQSVRK
jgi:beta-lactamase class A